ncbi:S-layer homology domain-containing protein [Paenibacillus sp. NPDC058174]|uniref:S-layer homology domain-containing protein n=1 Tax=Paenibacillus sp. NPDC058174 TaxID=3346366 RepID=UPI0036DD7516
MNRLWKSFLSSLVAVALLVTMLPVSPAKADSIYFQFTDFSTVQSSPTVVNTSTVDLRGSFSDVSSGSITYKVERLVNGNVVASTNGGITPSIIGNTFFFAGIQLFEGLNRITVIGTSGNGSGGIVEGVSYVSYGNVPVITSVQLANGTPLTEGQPVVVTTANPSLMVKATNAQDVLINGVAMFNGGAGTFVLSDLNLQLGLNKLQIVSRNGDKSFTVNRELVYFKENTPTPYNVFAGTTQLDGKPIVAPIATQTITGKILFKTATAPSTPNPTIDLELVNEAGTSLGVLNTTVQKGTVNQDWTEFTFTSTTDLTAGTSGKYQLWVRSNSYDGSTANFPVEFTVRSANAAYITDLRQLYDVSFNGTTATFGSSTRFSNNVAVSQVPLWIAVDTMNFDLSAGNTTSISAKVNGVAAGSSFSATAFTTSDGKQRIYRIDAMPQGEIELSFTVTKGTESNTVTRTFHYNPISSIQVTNTYNGAVYYDINPLGSITGKLLNFRASDIASFRFSLNGVTSDVSGFVTAATGAFTIPITQLVFGSNELVLSGTANGVAVTTTLVIYRFSDKQPTVSGIKPVPYTVDPINDSESKRLFADPDRKFIPGSSAFSYTTSQKKADILFTVTNLANLIIKVDGVDYATATVNTADNVMTVTPADLSKLFIEPSTSPTQKTYNLRLFGLALPVSGAKSITIISQVGTESVSQTITITRELPPYELLSPKLPQEAVINQNFLNVSIRAEGADRVVIGKDNMIKSVNDEIFRYELQGLKAGVNKIKFTVYRGTEKLNGEFSVNYAADNSIGAQYKAAIPKTGKLSAFKGEVTVSFPKNTFLRPANINPGQDVKTIDLFDSQKILFGIADRTDGRTVKVYNAVGEYDGANAKDGTFSTVSFSDFGAAVIRPTAHFGFASNLFWIDPGYVEGTVQTGYTFQQGKQPYNTSNEFFSRPLTRWLETSNSGEITLKYDSKIVNTAANTLSIWRYYNGRWENMGGKINVGSKTITAPINGFGYYVVMQIRYSFTDIIGHEYARNSLELMYGRGIMNSKNNNEFGVYDNITRGEFAQLLVKMYQIPLEYNPNDMTFDDVVPVLGLSPFWDYRYIETAVRKGIIRGKGPRQFLPNEPLTREEAAVMIARAGNLVKDGKEDQKRDRTALQKLFTDANLVDGYALSSVLAVNKAKFIEGLPNTTTGTAKPTFRFDPKSNLKRADAAIIAERVMRKNGLL